MVIQANNRKVILPPCRLNPSNQPVSAQIFGVSQEFRKHFIMNNLYKGRIPARKVCQSCQTMLTMVFKLISTHQDILIFNLQREMDDSIVLP
jgi:hypothetical protein